MLERREFLSRLSVGGGAFALGSVWPTVPGAACDPASPTVQALHDEVAELPIDDTHCHPLTDEDAETDPQRFLLRLSLAAFPIARYFPDGVYREWRDGNPASRARLNRQYEIQAALDRIASSFRESAFVKYMVKEMATFLGCESSLEAVIEARNARSADYGSYVSDLFRDVRIANVMIDTGYAEGLDAAGIERFERAIAPTRSRRILRVETIQWDLVGQNPPFQELRDRFVDRVREGLDGTGNYGARSYGMKSYLMPRIGIVKPLYDPEPARISWERFRATRDDEPADREERADRGKDLFRYLLTLALEECLERDMPMQFHAGDGEAPGIILRRQDPYFLEEVVRFDRDGVMRMPKIIPVHAGYPLVGRAAWLSHLYTNCYFELSLMTPFIHHGLYHRYLQVMEAVPLDRILFGSDAYHLPELYWLAGRWGKRYLSQALATYVDAGVLAHEEAVAAARRILSENNREAYGFE